MTTLSTIVSDAFRESNLIAISADPTADEIEEALRLLNRNISSIIGYDLGESLEDTPYGRASVTRTSEENYAYDTLLDSSYARENTRIVLNLEENKTVYLPPVPQDGARIAITDPSNTISSYTFTLNGNGRTIEGAASVSILAGTIESAWFYRADISNWARVDTLTAVQDSPFPSKYDDLLVIGLAIRLNPRNGQPIDPQSLEVYRNLMKQFRAQYKQNREMSSEEGLLRMSSRYGRDGTDSNTFYRGW